MQNYVFSSGFIKYSGGRDRQAAPRAPERAFGYTIVAPNGNRKLCVFEKQLGFRNHASSTGFTGYCGRRNRRAAPGSAGRAFAHTIVSANENRGYSCCPNYRAATPQNGKSTFSIDFSVVNYVCSKLVCIVEKNWDIFSVKY